LLNSCLEDTSAFAVRGASGERAQVKILALIASETPTEFRSILDQLLGNSELWIGALTDFNCGADALLVVAGGQKGVVANARSLRVWVDEAAPLPDSWIKLVIFADRI